MNFLNCRKISNFLLCLTDVAMRSCVLKDKNMITEKQYLEAQKIVDAYEEQLQKPNVSISLPNYEYEMLIDDEGTPFEINSWIPITTDRIKDPSRIDEYIAKGLIRKRQ